jgi:hypothetical protein
MLNPRTALTRALVAFAIIALSILPLAKAQNGGNFFAGIDFAADADTIPTNTGYYGGIRPVQVISADVNDDKKMDLVVAASCDVGLIPGCAAGSVVAVYLGNGDGTFQPPILNEAGLPHDLRSIVVGDFNHDGYPDVAAAADCLSAQDCSSGTVTILLGDGKGNLNQSSQYPINGTVGQPNTLAVGQFTEGGNLALVVGIFDIIGSSLGATAVYPGDGHGGLGTPTYYQTPGEGALYPVVDDFNGDGNLDVAVADAGSNVGMSLTVLLGSGKGTFAKPSTTEEPYAVAYQMVSADFNDDKKKDLAIVTNSGVEILFGVGNGTFRIPTAYGLGSYNASIAATDVNDDGKLDLVVGSSGNGVSGNAAIPLINTGGGAFTVGATYPLGDLASVSIAVADFNGDSKQDIVLAGVETISVLLGNGDGTMQGAVPAGVTIVPKHQVLVDMNGDGIPDMVGTEDAYEGDEQTDESAVVVALGIGDGKFGPSVEYPSGLYLFPDGLAVADINNDGYLDVVINGSAISGSDFALAVMLGSKGGGLGSPTTYALPMEPRGAPAIGDFAGNKKLGVAVVQESENGGASGVGILLGNGDGTLQAEKFTETSEIYPLGLAVGDFNKDGKADVAAFGDVTAEPVYSGSFAYDSAVTVLLGKGDGSFTVKPDPDHNPASNYLYSCNDDNLCVFLASYPSLGQLGSYYINATTGPIATADLDGDGNLDLIMANYCRLNDSGCSTGELVYFPGNGNGTFKDAAPALPQVPDANYLGVAIADVNSDGKPDIVASTAYGIAVSLAPFTKPGTIYATSVIRDAEIPAIADINGDGAPDIAISNGSGIVDLLFNRFPRDKSTATTLLSSANPSRLGKSVTFTAKVTAASGSTPTGFVTFTNNGTVYPAVALSGGVATYTTSTLPVGDHEIVATYSGSATDSASTASLNLTVVPPPAVLTTPAPGATLPGTSATFTWSGASTSGNDGYWLFLGTTGAGSKNLYDSGQQTATSAKVNNLPTNGETIYARLFTDYNGTLIYNDYTYKAAAQAVLTTPAPGSTLTGTSATFTWTAATGSGNEGYWLFLGTTGVGSKDLYDSGQQKATSATVSNLPTIGKTIYARVYTDFNGTLVYNDYTYTAK